LIYSQQLEELVGLIKDNGPCAVAFSGGVDSSVVAAAAFKAHGSLALAVTVASELFPEAEVSEAEAVASAIGIRHKVMRVSVLSNEAVTSNPVDRCYHCKSDDFSAIRDAASEEGISLIYDGSNADDPKGHRPGLRALKEMGIRSPLMELGLNKEAVRGIAALLGLPNHDRPSSPCLASRFPYGIRLTADGIERVRAAEEFIRSLGVRVLRVRAHDRLARIEVEPSALPLLASDGVRQKIVDKLISLGYNYVTLDLQGFRSGSLDIGIAKPDMPTADQR
jgi:pyridinium-3,5-biscarboxylic acid mononucleotide sulfurtransferase